MIQSIAIYLSLTFIMILLGNIAEKNRSFSPIVLSLLLYSIVFGCRWGVGVDYFNYLEAYLYSQISDNLPSSYSRWEGGFVILTKLFSSSLDLHYSIYFGIIAYFQIFLFFFRLRREYYIFPLLTFTFMFGCNWLTFSNGLRQILAVSIFFYSIPYLANRRYLNYIIAIIIASLFHKSAILLLVLPLLPLNSNFFSKRNFQILLLFLAVSFVFIGTKFNIFEYLNQFILIMGYDYYEGGSNAETSEIVIGAGFFITLISYFIMIFNSENVKKAIPYKYYYLIYNLFFIGVIIKYMFLGILLIVRINYYFIILDFVVGAFTLYYLFKNHKLFQGLTLLSLYVLIFVAVMYNMDINTAEFNFWWD